MANNVAIGIQDFKNIRQGSYFYIDKSDFIREWWESGDSVTLIARPRRFGKTLNMSMLEAFFSLDYAGRGDLFEGLSIWNDGKYRELQGTYPVIFLSFANVKEQNFESARKKICQMLAELYGRYEFLCDTEKISENDRKFFKQVSADMDDSTASIAINYLSKLMYQYYGKKVIILLDEYDTPMQEAYVAGYWSEFAGFIRNLFNSTFKTNPYLERAVMTGITRVSKESIFSDLNNLKVVTTTSPEYATAFGFTETEVFDALDGHGLADKKELVKQWYDGFTFGKQRDIYNPWSIINFLDTGIISTYWANTSSNSLVGRLIRTGSVNVKSNFEKLLCGESITCAIDEQIVYNQLDGSESAIYSLLLASGYLKVLKCQTDGEAGKEGLPEYELTLTNREVKSMFKRMVHGWFERTEGSYNDFVKALLLDDLDAMNEYMNRVSIQMFSYFDTENAPSFDAPERFYHGFVLGLLVDLSKRFIVTSNHESGFGRYDVMIEPKDVTKDNAYIIEFKVLNHRREKTLEETVEAAHAQIEDRKYAEVLVSRGVPEEHIRKYGFAFQGKEVLIG